MFQGVHWRELAFIRGSQIQAPIGCQTVSALEDLKTNDPEGFTAFKAALPKSNFLSYVLTNVETNLASANLKLMRDYATLPPDLLLSINAIASGLRTTG